MTEEQLLEALRHAMTQPADPSGTFSLADVMESMGVGGWRARRLIRSLVLSGEAEVERVAMRNIVGVVTPIARYRLVRKPG